MNRAGLLLALAAVMGLAASGGSSEMAADAEPPTSAVVTGPTTKTQRESLRAKGDGGPLAPDITGTTLDGKQVSLADFRGRPLFVKVFAGY